MIVGLQRGLSERERASIREFKAFQVGEARREREAEDRSAYQIYLDTLASEQQRVPSAYQVQPLSFEEWRTNMPPDEQDPAVRGLVASLNAATKQHVAYYRDKAASESLSDEDLRELGFDLSKRPIDGSDVDGVFLRQAYDSFMAVQKSEYNHDLHFDALSKFIDAYRLNPTFRNIQGAFSVLWHLGLVQPAAPKPPNPELNEHGVNLRIEPNPEVEREQARKRYREEVVVVDPRDGKGYTQFQLDNVVSADDFKRLTMGENFIPTIRTVIKPGLK